MSSIIKSMNDIDILSNDGYLLILLLHVHLITHIFKFDTENYKQKVGGWVPDMKTSLN